MLENDQKLLVKCLVLSRYPHYIAWVSGLPKGTGERRFLMGRGKGEKRKEGLTQNHSANRVTHPESGCGSDWITHNTPWRHRPQVNTSRVFWFHVLILWIETQRGIQRNSRGRSQVLSGNKNKTRARIVFSRPRSLKERCTRSMEKPHIPASAETMSEYWFHKTRTKKTISVLQISKFWFTTSCR